MERPASDLFATAENALVDRFYAWHAEPMAECTDVLSGPAWFSSACPSCGQRHREFPFMFLPRVLWPRIVAKLRADQVRAFLDAPLCSVRPVRAHLGCSVAHVRPQPD